LLGAANKAKTLRVFLAAAVVMLAVPAGAAEVTHVVSGYEHGNWPQVEVSLSYLHEVKTGSIQRESQSDLSPTIQLKNDLKYFQTRDLLDPRVEVGVWRDIWLRLGVPLVLSDARHLESDTGVVGQPPTIVRDGILPPTTSSTVFQGPNRSGAESLDLGIRWAIFNQARDDTKPTWTVGFDAKLDVFGDMRYDAANPGANTAVGLGYHQLVISTFFSKRFPHIDPYFGAWFMQPVRTNGSIYQQYPGGNQTAVNPQQRAGLLFGFEQIAWEDPHTMSRFTVEVRGHAEERFFGRSATELWEPLSGRSDCKTNVANCRAGIDGDLNGDGQPDPYPGVTETQAYATFGGLAGFNVHVGRHVRFRGLFDLSVEMPHFLTFANAGVDRNNDGHVDSNDPTEANPVYREAIDIPGRRFKIEDTRIWSLFFEGIVAF
jgi:hypothetical protein